VSILNILKICVKNGGVVRVRVGLDEAQFALTSHRPADPMNVPTSICIRASAFDISISLKATFSA
jgi:hypothetical protein